MNIDYKEVEQKFIQMREDDFSKEILIPLFSRMFNGRVEFVGGAVEKGRDILIEDIDGFGLTEYIGIQVKKIKPKVNSSSNSFQQLLTQLDQCRDESVIDRNAKTTKITKVCFITPYLISQRILDSHSGAFKKIHDKGVKIFDGKQIVNFIDTHYPDLLSTVYSDGEIIQKRLSSQLNNSVLMKALNIEKSKTLCEIYCDIKISIGNVSQDSYLDSDISVVKEYFELSLRSGEIDRIKNTSSGFNDYFYSELLEADSFAQIDLFFERIERIKEELTSSRSLAQTIRESVNDMIQKSKFIIRYPKSTRAC